jgi:hypothetical protein
VNNASDMVANIRSNKMLDALKDDDWDAYYKSLVGVYIGPLLMACVFLVIWFA